MKLGIVIPYRPTPERVRLFDYAHNWLKTEFVDAPIYIGDSDKSRKFNVSEARNRGCLQAINDGVDILMVIDADTVPTKTGVEKAIKSAESGELVMSKGYIRLNENETVDILSGKDRPKAFGEKVLQNTPGGLWVMPAEVFTTLNGWDERFIGWGYEDTSFQVAYRKIYKRKVRRVKTALLSLWHSRRNLTIDSYLRNESRYLEYKRADADSIKELIAGNMAHLGKR